MSSPESMEAQARVTKEMSAMVDELDRTRLRKIQLMMHKCAAKCCENEAASLEQTQRCIDQCSGGVRQAQDYVQHEIGNLQNRLQRCVLDCQDTAKDKLGSNPSDDEIKAVQGSFESCAIKCVDNHIGLLPDLLRRMQAHLDKIK